MNFYNIELSDKLGLGWGLSLKHQHVKKIDVYTVYLHLKQYQNIGQLILLDMVFILTYSSFFVASHISDFAFDVINPFSQNKSRIAFISQLYPIICGSIHTICSKRHVFFSLLSLLKMNSRSMSQNVIMISKTNFMFFNSIPIEQTHSKETDRPNDIPSSNDWNNR